jgi:ribonuclease HII
MRRVIIGVDEAGRGPWAGPVSVGAVAVSAGFDVREEFAGVADSKQLSEEARERIYGELLRRRALGDVRFTVRFSSPAYIDEFGITRAVRRGVWGGVRFLSWGREKDAEVFLDGLLQAPRGFAQHTIVRGDDTVPIISLASIAAKVERDRLMKRLAKKYPGYGFEKHKGYGTAAHRAAIDELGLCEIHRRTYLRA